MHDTPLFIFDSDYNNSSIICAGVVTLLGLGCYLYNKYTAQVAAVADIELHEVVVVGDFNPYHGG